MPELAGLLCSQIGYDLGCPMRAIVRSTQENYLSEGAQYTLRSAQTGEVILTAPVVYWGEVWKSYWWVADFSALQKVGEYTIEINSGGQVICQSEPIHVGENVLWNETITAVALDQLEERHRLARNGMGWKDCGSYWREANSHTTTVIGLTDLLNHAYEWLTKRDTDRLVDQIIVGCDLLAMLQDRAAEISLPAGAIVHEMSNHQVIIPGDQAQSVVALARASRLIYEYDRVRSVDYLRRAEQAYLFLTRTCKPYGQEGFSAMGHGAPANFRVPQQWMTRDLLMMCWGAVELWINGKGQYKEEAVAFAKQVMQRQVPPEQPEGEFYGHFYTFSDCNFTEKANVHHHVGHDTGATFPHYLVPLLEMISRWYDHPQAPEWRRCVRNFAYGYLLPACSKNPFYLLPVGYFAGQGLLAFCGPWHGINTTYGFAASLAARLESFFGDSAFRQIAVGNIQWMAGLHAGITCEAMAGNVLWKEEIPAGVALPYSQIYGIGRRWVGNWTGIYGTIPNGFDTNPQFQLVIEPTVENDGPWLYTDEDWIPHGAGWVSALALLREMRFFRG